MAEHKLSVLRPEVWPSLERRLLEASQRSASNSTRDALTRPVELLSLMAADAAPALAEDALAAERLRMVLYLAAPYHALVEEARVLAKADHGSDAAYEPGVLDHGALAMVALAAMRVAPHGAEQMFVRTIHGLALSAAPAEVLGRLGPRMPDADGLAVMLDTLYLLDTVGASLKAPLLRPFANDPSERARWACLSRLLEEELPAAIAEALSRARLPHNRPPPWNGAFAAGIDDVQPQRAAPGHEIAITGKISGLGTSKLPERVRVVFASPDRPPLPARALSLESGAQGITLRVEVPAGAQGGWIGFSDDKLVAASNEFRAALQQVLPAVLQRQKSLRGSELPPGLPPLLGAPDPERPGKLLATPPRTAGNRWTGPAAAATVRIAPSGAAFPPPPGMFAASMVPPVMPRILAARAFQESREAPLYAVEPVEVTVVVDPAKQESSLSLELRVFPAPPELASLHPDPGHVPGAPFHFTVPPGLLNDGVMLVAVLLQKGQPIANRDLGPLSFARPRQEPLVLVQPALVDEHGVPHHDGASVYPLLRAEARRCGVELDIVELPWVDDELAVLTSPLGGGDDARIPGLLEALSRRAMLTPGLEGAPWVLLAPRFTPQDPDPLPVLAASMEIPRQPAFFRAMPAEAARAVAVANERGLPDLLNALFRTAEPKPSHAARVPRLRLLGTFDEHEVQLEPVLEEVRAAGPGAPIESKLIVAALDSRGRELLVSHPTCLRVGAPAQLAVLLPVSPEVAAVEIRRGLRRLLLIERTAGKGELHLAALSGHELAARQALHWRFTHSQGARPEVSLALGSDGMQTEVLRIDACEHDTPLHLTRYRSASRLKLCASDGWNVARKDVVQGDGPASLKNETPVQIRRLADGRFFADVPQGWHVTWSLRGRTLQGQGMLLALPRGTSGVLELKARDAHDEKAPVVRDERRVEA